MRAYKTSKDYKRLKELLDNGYRVVVFVKLHDGLLSEMRRGDESWPGWSMGARYGLYGGDFCRTFYENRNEDPIHRFEENCRFYRIEYIEPNITL